MNPITAAPSLSFRSRPVDPPTAGQPQVDSWFDPATWTVTHLVHTGPGSHAVVIDPVLDYDHAAGRTATGSAQRVLDAVAALDLRVAWILETHAHADHLSAADWLRTRLGAPVAIGERIASVQRTFEGLFNLPAGAPGGSFDRLLADGEVLEAGGLRVAVMAVPGHTPACVAYRIGDALFVGDTLFMPDVGTARCDFPGGDAHALYASVRRLLALPGDTRLFVCHDYPPAGRAVRVQTSVTEQRVSNVHVHDGVDEAAFVAMRRARDATLSVPALILPSVQVNIRAGQLPPPEANGRRYLKVPLDAL